jgi:hypothetical protein
MRLRRGGATSVRVAITRLNTCVSDPAAATAIITGFNLAIPSVALCLALNLARSHTHKVPRCKLSKELLFCFVLPVTYIALRVYSPFLVQSEPYHRTDTIVQDHRYDIIENVGCRPATYASLPSVILVWLPPILLSISTLAISGKQGDPAGFYCRILMLIQPSHFGNSIAIHLIHCTIRHLPSHYP